jgi:hypothetical protein
MYWVKCNLLNLLFQGFQKKNPPEKSNVRVTIRTLLGLQVLFLINFTLKPNCHKHRVEIQFVRI